MWLESTSLAGVVLGELGQPVEGGLFGLVSPSDQKTVGKVVCELQHNFVLPAIKMSSVPQR